MKYILMHKEYPVLEIKLDEITGGIMETGELYSPERIPVGISFEGKAIDRAGLNHWWRSRAIPANRSGIKDALECFNFSTLQVLMFKCFGVSLSDQYWVRPENRELRWADINFFENPFSGDVDNVLFGIHPDGDTIDMLSPDNTTDGLLKKRWKNINGTRRLIKGGSAPFYQEPLNEVFASKLMKRLEIAYVPYDLIWIDGLPHSVCPDFVTADTEFVSAYHICKTLPKSSDDSKYKHFIKCCEELGVSGVAPQIDRMLTVDFLLANKDRHMGNFGVLRNADTLKWLGPAPIYDCGTALWHNRLWPNTDTHSEQIRLVRSFDWLNLSALDGAADDLEQVLALSPLFMDDERRGILCGAFESRVKMLRELVRVFITTNSETLIK